MLNKKNHITLLKSYLFSLAPTPNTQVSKQAATLQEERAKPCCRTCGQPMKGHKNVLTCPRNQKQVEEYCIYVNILLDIQFIINIVL